MKRINFNETKKETMIVTLPNEEKTEISVLTPTKAIYDEVKKALETISNEEDFDVFDIAAKIISRNKEGHVIDKKELGEILDYEDVMVLIYGYIEFVEGITGQKN